MSHRDPGSEGEALADAAGGAAGSAQGAAAEQKTATQAAATGEHGAPARNVMMPPEIGGRDGPEPTRFGDWEKAGRCIDF